MSATIIRLVRDRQTGKVRPVAQADIDARVATLEAALATYHASKREVKS